MPVISKSRLITKEVLAEVKVRGRITYGRLVGPVLEQVVMPCWCDSEALILGKHAYAIQITSTSPVLIGIQDVDGLAAGATVRPLCDLHEVILRGVNACFVPT